jgi:hypothetical protein
MLEDNPRSYSSAEVCRAAGLPRPTFDAWLLRRYLPLPLGPGTGRSRTYSLLDAVRISVVFELNRLGINVGTAGRFAGLIVDRSIDPAAERRTGLILAPSAGPREEDAEQRGPGAVVFQFKGWREIEFTLRMHFIGGPPVGFVMLDITAIADRTRAALETPDSPPPVKTWLNGDNWEPEAPAAKAGWHQARANKGE